QVVGAGRLGVDVVLVDPGLRRHQLVAESFGLGLVLGAQRRGGVVSPGVGGVPAPLTELLGRLTGRDHSFSGLLAWISTVRLRTRWSTRSRCSWVQKVFWPIGASVSTYRGPTGASVTRSRSS